MSVASEVARFEATLREAAGLCGLSSDLLKREDADEAAAVRGVSPDSLAAMDQQALDRWFSVLGNALTITCELPGFGPWEAGDDSHVRSALDPLLEEARSLGSNVDVRIRIRKSPIEQRLLGMIPGAAAQALRIALFFSGARLAEILGQPDAHFRFFEDHFLQAVTLPVDRRLLILLADVPGRLRGRYLAVLGNGHLDEAVDFAVLSESLEPLAKTREIALRECNWDARPKLLTPDFFALDSTLSNDLGDVRAGLIRLQNELSVPYLANRTGGEPGALDSFFEGPRTVEVVAGTVASSDNLYQLYHWTYGEPASVSTKLEIVRRVVASRFPAKSIEFRLLAEKAEELLSEAKVQLRVLVDDNVVKSFERRERVDKLVRDYADGVTKQTQALTREVVDNVYKTAGILFGVVIAYLLKPDQGTKVLILSVLFYAAYILLVRFFYLNAVRREQESRRRDYQRSSRFFKKSEILTQEAKSRLRSVRREERKFAGTFRWVSRFYISLAVIPLLALTAWLWWRDPKPTAEEVRANALGEQARRFKALKYEDVLLKLPGKPMPVPLMDRAGKAMLFPDLTAIKKDGTLVVLAWVPCSRIGKAEELERLTRLHGLAAQHNADLHFLTESACEAEPGPDRLRTWLGGKIPAPRVWSF